MTEPIWCVSHTAESACKFLVPLDIHNSSRILRVDVNNEMEGHSMYVALIKFFSSGFSNCQYQ